MKKTDRKTGRTTSKEASATKSEVPNRRANANPGDDLSLSEIKQLIELVSDKQFNEFELERGNFRLRLLKGAGKSPASQISVESSVATEQVALKAPVNTASPAPQNVAPPPAASSPAAQEENLHIVTSPIVGTFYSSPSPTADPYVKVGETIETGKVLCIIEAMKLMNEIQSDASGTIAKIFVENGQPVEYGQALFGIKK